MYKGILKIDAFIGIKSLFFEESGSADGCTYHSTVHPLRILLELQGGITLEQFSKPNALFEVAIGDDDGLQFVDETNIGKRHTKITVFGRAAEGASSVLSLMEICKSAPRNPGRERISRGIAKKHTISLPVSLSELAAGDGKTRSGGIQAWGEFRQAHERLFKSWRYSCAAKTHLSAFMLESPHVARFVEREGATGVLWVDDGRWQPLADVGYSTDLGYFSIAQFPNEPNEIKKIDS